MWPFGVDDDAGAQAALGAVAIAGRRIAEEGPEAAGLHALGHGPGGVDVDHGRSGALHRIRV